MRSSQSHESKERSYEMPAQGTFFIVIDYAKKMRPDGDYDIIVFELQKGTRSQLTLDGKTPEQTHIDEAHTFEKLFKREITYVARFGHGTAATDQLLNDVLKVQQKIIMKYGDAAYYQQFGAVLYNLAEFDFVMNDRHPKLCQYRSDFMIKKFCSDKVLQRLWCNSQSELQKMLPAKVMVATAAEVKPNHLAALADKMLNYFGEGSEVFLKSSCGSLGKRNVCFKLTDKDSLIVVLTDFNRMLTNTDYFTIESASRVGESQEKQRIDTYRMACAVTKDANNHLSFQAVNLWHTAGPIDKLSNHDHPREDFFSALPAPVTKMVAEGVECFYFGIKNDGTFSCK